MRQREEKLAAWRDDADVQESMAVVLEEANEEHPNGVMKTKGVND